MKRLPVFLLLLLMMLGSSPYSYAEKEEEVEAVDSIDGPKCPVVKMDVVRMPDLNIPRSGHTTLCLGGEFVVLGGHTTGFLPTPTAEYFEGGKWHQLSMVYEHDHALVVPLTSGKVLVAGGSEKPLGIGQTFWAEMYDPATHSFDGFGCLDQKRALAAGLELDSGKVVIAGNWYDDDCMEVFDGSRKFQFVKDLSVGRGTPWLLRIARDDALLLGSLDTRGVHTFHNFVERYRGDAFTVPLFNDWQPIRSMVMNHHTDGFIGDVSRDCYAHLLPVTNREGQMAICLLRDTVFTLLPTSCPVPMVGPFGSITYYSTVVVDKAAKCGYVVGCDVLRHLYVLVVDYSKALTDEVSLTDVPATLTLRYTDVLEDCGFDFPVLTPEGNLLIAGGIGCVPDSVSNFKPLSSVYLLPLGEVPAELLATSDTPRWWIWLCVVMAILAIASLIYLFSYLRKHGIQEEDDEDTSDAAVPEATGQQDDNPEEDVEGELVEEETLIKRVRILMEEQQLFLRPDLKVGDLVEMLGVNARYISNCIKTSEGCSFSTFLNRYRVEYAKRLLRFHPDKKMSVVAMDSGFANETSFFRTFKSFEGLTPGDWLSQDHTS